MWEFTQDKEITGRIREKLNALTSENHPSCGEPMEKPSIIWSVFGNSFSLTWKTDVIVLPTRLSRVLSILLSVKGETHCFSIVTGWQTYPLHTIRWYQLSDEWDINTKLLKEIFPELVKGCRGYRNLLLMTIGINIDNIKNKSVFELFNRELLGGSVPYIIRQNWMLTYLFI